MKDEEAKLGSLFDGEPLLVDVGDYLGGDVRVLRVKSSTGKKDVISRLYFPPSEFPPPEIDLSTKDIFETPSFIALKASILVTSHDFESPVVMNGDRPDGVYRDRMFVCQ